VGADERVDPFLRERLPVLLHDLVGGLVVLELEDPGVQRSRLGVARLVALGPGLKVEDVFVVCRTKSSRRRRPTQLAPGSSPPARAAPDPRLPERSGTPELRFQRACEVGRRGTENQVFALRPSDMRYIQRAALQS